MPPAAPSSQQFPLPYGRYVLTGLLGRGGMAEIFLAQQQGPHGFLREVVVKRMLPHISDDGDFVDMFIREAKLTARLVHPNITQVLDFGEEAGQLFLAMEFVDGTDARALLRQVRKAGHVLPIEVATYIVVEVARGLDYAHRLADPASGRTLGLVHRDITPSNVLLSREGSTKLCDFGVAHVGAEAATQAGTLKGKYGYMSPEQANGGPIDARSDIFTMGVLLWELVSARRMYKADSELGVLDLARRGVVPPLPRTDVPLFSALAAILDRALGASAEQRYPRAAELQGDLQDYLRAAGLFASSDDLAGLLERYCTAELSRSREICSGGASPSSVSSPRGGRVRAPSFGISWPAPSVPPPLPGTEPPESTPLPPVIVRPAVNVAEQPAPAPAPPAPPSEETEARAAALADKPTTLHDRLEEILLRAGVVDAQRLEAARAAAASAGRSVVYMLLAMRVVSDSDLAHAFGVLLDLPVVDLAAEVVLDSVARRIPAALATRLSVVPFRLVDTGMGRPTLYLAVANPAALGRLHEIEFATGAKVRPFIARQAAVLARIRRAYYNEDLPVPPLSPPPVFRKSNSDADG